jgi:H+/gluconate symporter-like permease
MKLAGNKIMALGIGAFIALILVMRQCKLNWQSLSDKCGGPLETAGVIILITSAGGAFGLMIVGEELLEGRIGLKNLSTGEQETVALNEAAARIGG